MVESLAELFRHGGSVLVAIAIVSALAWSLLVWQWLRLGADPTARSFELPRLVSDSIRQGSTGAFPGTGAFGAMGPLLHPGGALPHDRAAFALELASRLRSKAVLLECPLRVAAVLTAALPLLGLLGTVLGMMQTFGALTERSVQDLDALAGGISKALITTQAGLVLALPALLLHGWLASRVRRQIETDELTLKKVESLLCRDRAESST
ncbi:MAG TPA: MotA/TolQ/ExbB proton channel family protein [Planctomycetota bacterium]|nr:MotA/TolQ/ExbB proton channel family protein [Planctomycetota bacterium]